MLTSEERKIGHEKKVALAQELRGKIVRAQSWSQLFATPQVAEADFLEYLVGATRKQYEGNRTLLEYRIEPDSAGEIHTFVRTLEGYNSTYQRLNNGDVIITFHYPDKPPSTNLVKTSIGNINHPFSLANTISPHFAVIRALIRDPEKMVEVREAVGISPDVLITYLEGKPASQGWEDILLYNGHLPERIGHRIFPHFVLEAQSKFAEHYPHWMSIR